MIFMQLMPYNAPNHMYVFKKFSGGDTPGPPFDNVTQNRPPSLQNPGCSPESTTRTQSPVRSETGSRR